MLRSLVFISLLALIPTLAVADQALVLSEDCPPGFELASGHCELRTLYQLYDSLQSAGVGGLKTGLPAHRDGFSPQETDLGRSCFLTRCCRLMAACPAPAATTRTVVSPTAWGVASVSPGFIFL